MKKNKKFTSILTHILALLVGLSPTIVGFFIEDYFKRPQIECNINCINIIDNENNDLILNLYVQFENTGQSNTTISLDNLKLQFRDINGKPYSFNLNKKIEIDGLSFVSDTLEVILPKQLDSITVLPEIKTLLLDYHELKSKKNTFIEKKSSDVIWGFIQGRRIPENPDSFSYHSDYIVKNGTTQITGRKVPIEYKGKIYTCILYPRDAYISYKVDNGLINITYGQNMKFPLGKDGKSELLVKPLIFIPAHEIEDKCVLPNGFVVSLSQEIEENEEIKIKNYSVKIKDMRDNKKQIVYFFK